VVHDSLLGFDPERWTCGRPVKADPFTGKTLVECGSALVRWTPIVRVHIPGEEPMTACAGMLTMCTPCRLVFSVPELMRTGLWRSFSFAYREKTGRTPEAKHVDIEWIDAVDFLKEAKK
jgi:hypothetical protein